MMELDDFQKEVLAAKGNIVVRTGRQRGKSTIISIKAAQYAVQNHNKVIMVVASVERQAALLFDKIHAYLHDNYKNYLSKGKDKPTKHIIKLKNGSIIYCLPTGLNGFGIRGYSIDLMIFEEAAFIPNEVFVSLMPSLAARPGCVCWLLSTPFGREGYFYDCFSDDNYTKFHSSSEECSRIPKSFLEQEKKRMTKLQYTQEYLGEFIDDLRRLFSDELINSTCIIKTPSERISSAFLGVDIARMGEDKSVFVSLEKRDEKILMFDMLITQKNVLTDTIDNIKKLHEKNHYKTIYIDADGVGAGVFDVLVKEPHIKDKMVAISNAKRSMDADDQSKGKLQKESKYMNLLYLMESKKIELLASDELKLALRGIQFDYNEQGKMQFMGHSEDEVEALCNAAWCAKNKHLNVWAR